MLAVLITVKACCLESRSGAKDGPDRSGFLWFQVGWQVLNH